MSFGGVPHPLDAAEVSSVKALVASGLETEPWPYLKTGERVLIGSGPLSGVEGTLLQIKNQLRLVVSVTLLQRSVAVEVDSDSVLNVR